MDNRRALRMTMLNSTDPVKHSHKMKIGKLHLTPLPPPPHTHTRHTSAPGTAYCLPYQLVGAADGGVIAFRQTMLRSFQNLYCFVCPLPATIRTAITNPFYFVWHQLVQIKYLAVDVFPKLYDAYH